MGGAAGEIGRKAARSAVAYFRKAAERDSVTAWGAGSSDDVTALPRHGPGPFRKGDSVTVRGDATAIRGSEGDHQGHRWPACYGVTKLAEIHRNRRQTLLGPVGALNSETIVAEAKAETLLIFDNATVVLEMGREGNFFAKASGWEANRTFLDGQKIEIGSIRAAGSWRGPRARSNRHRRLSRQCTRTTCNVLQVPACCALRPRKRPNVVA